jgi:hypothetical protein
LRRAERHTPLGGLVRFLDQFGDVQQRLRGNAAAIEAHAAGVLFLVHQRYFESEVRREERRRIAARPAAHYHEFAHSHLIFAAQDYHTPPGPQIRRIFPLRPARAGLGADMETRP